MAKLRIGLLNKKRGNFGIQAKFSGQDNVVDTTDAEVAHHEQALTEAGYDVDAFSSGAEVLVEPVNRRDRVRLRGGFAGIGVDPAPPQLDLTQAAFHLAGGS